MSKPKIDLLYDAATIHNRVQAVGQRIQQDYADKDPLVLSIVGGSVLFLADLIRAIDQPLRFEFVQVHFAAAGPDDDILEIHYPISLDVRDQPVLVVKDVVTSGVIETYLRNQFLERGAQDVQLAALIDVTGERTTDLEADYRVFSPHQKSLFVGYGLKLRGRYGNLPYIGRLDETSRERNSEPTDSG